MQMFDSLEKMCRGRMAPRLAGAFAAAVLIAGGCKRGEASHAPMGPMAVLVTTAEVTTRDVPVYLDQIGKCMPFQSVSIKPQVTGMIQKIHFVDGADVKKGDVLFEIDPSPYKAMLDQAKAQLSQAKATLSFATVDFNRIKDLPRSVEPQSDFDAKQSAIDVAKAQVEAADAAITAATVNLQYCKIDSPLDGMAGQRLIDQGNVVIANNPIGPSAAILTIQQLDPIYADFTVTESDLKAVRANMAGGTLKTLVRLPNDQDPREGDLSFLDNMIQDGSGTIKLRATIKNKDRHFWPGQFAFITLVLKVEKDALLVPSSAVQVGQKGQFVYVVKSDSTADLRPVELGQPQGDQVVILKGVKAGEKVIATGQMMVFPGAKLREPEAKPAEEDAPPLMPATRPTTAPARTLPVANEGGKS